MVGVAAVVVAGVVVVVSRDNNPQETRPPALLCIMNGLPNTAVLSELIENTNTARPEESVLP
jgi:hypothetical protein